MLGGLIFVGLQLRLDRQVALANAVDQGAADLQVWAQLITENVEVWRKGLFGEPLSESEQLEFEALARAWELRQFSNWNRTLLTISEQPADRWVREAALEIHRYPGLRAFWHSHEEKMRLVGATTGWLESVSAELERLDRANAE